MREGTEDHEKTSLALAVLALCLALAGCGGWNQIDSLTALDRLTGKRVEIPLSFFYGYQSDSTTAFVSDWDTDRLCKELQSLHYTAQSFSENRILVESSDQKQGGMWLILEQAPDKLNAPQNQFPHAYLLSDFSAKIAREDGSVLATILFPWHLKKADGFLDVSRPFFLGTDYSITGQWEEIVDFYDRLAQRYGLNKAYTADGQRLTLDLPLVVEGETTVTLEFWEKDGGRFIRFTAQ